MSPREFAQSRYATPPGATEIVFVRHGESAPYVEGVPFALHQGHGDPDLAPEGVLSAKLAAERLLTTDERIAAVYVTTLRRTHQTAAPLVAELGIEPIVLADLREIFLGEWEGIELRRRFADGDPLAMRVATEHNWGLIPGAETNDAFGTRIRRGVETIVAAHPDELAVAYVHGGVIGEIMRIASGSGLNNLAGPDNASMTHLIVTAEGRWVVRCFNDTGHLWPTFSTRA